MTLTRVLFQAEEGVDMEVEMVTTMVMEVEMVRVRIWCGHRAVLSVGLAVVL